MSKWYVEYKSYGKTGWISGIEAESGNDAIKYVKANIIGVNKIIGVWHDDEETGER